MSIGSSRWFLSERRGTHRQQSKTGTRNLSHLTTFHYCILRIPIQVACLVTMWLV